MNASYRIYIIEFCNFIAGFYIQTIVFLRLFFSIICIQSNKKQIINTLFNFNSFIINIKSNTFHFYQTLPLHDSNAKRNIDTGQAIELETYKTFIRHDCRTPRNSIDEEIPAKGIKGFFKRRTFFFRYLIKQLTNL